MNVEISGIASISGTNIKARKWRLSMQIPKTWKTPTLIVSDRALELLTLIKTIIY